MTVRELLTYIESVKPHVFPDSALLLWLNELEGRVQLDIFLMAQEETVEYTLPDDNETVLLVDLPHTGIYRYWLEAMIDFESGEYSQYQNSVELFNNAWNEFACWFAETQGTEGDGVSRGFYLSAYGIAVKHGYTGSEEEWLETLKGEPGEDFKYEDFTEAQLAALRIGLVQDALDRAAASAEAAEESAEKAHGDAQAAEESARAAEAALSQMGDDAAAAAASAAAAQESETAAATSAKAAQDAQTGAEKAKYAVENLEVDAVSVPSGMPAYAQKSMNPEKEVIAIRFGIPKAVSPTVEVTEYAENDVVGGTGYYRTGHEVTITDEEGEKKFRVPDGANGADGGRYYPSVNKAGYLEWDYLSAEQNDPINPATNIVQMVLDAMPENGGEEIQPPSEDIQFDDSHLLDKETYDPQGKNTDIFRYVDLKVASVPVQDVEGAITIHNANGDAHNDIRLLITELNNRLDAAGGGALIATYGVTTFSEIATAVAEGKAVEAVWGNAQIKQQYQLQTLSPANGFCLFTSVDEAGVIYFVRVDDNNNWTSGYTEQTIPTVTAADNGKFMRVVNGVWAAVALTDVSEVGA